MVLDGAFYASTLASLMMNGVCCAWQMQEEEERRDAIRHDIRVEYERQRLQEKEMYEQMHSLYSHGSFAQGGSPEGNCGDERRRKLVTEKLRLSVNSPISNADNGFSSPLTPPSRVQSHRHHTRYPIPKKTSPGQGIPVRPCSPHCETSADGAQSKVTGDHRRGEMQLATSSTRCLMDEDDEMEQQDADEVQSLVDVALQ